MLDNFSFYRFPFSPLWGVCMHVHLYALYVCECWHMHGGQRTTWGVGLHLPSCVELVSCSNTVSWRADPVLPRVLLTLPSSTIGTLALWLQPTMSV